MIIWRSIFTSQMLQENRKKKGHIMAHPFPRSERVGIGNQEILWIGQRNPAGWASNSFFIMGCKNHRSTGPGFRWPIHGRCWEMLAVGRWMKPMDSHDDVMLLVTVGLWWIHILIWMWVNMEDLGDHRCSSLV